MTTSKPNHIALAEYFCSRDTIPPLSAFALTVAYQTTVWSNRARTRKALRKVSVARLKDIGLSQTAAYEESRKWFWRA